MMNDVIAPGATPTWLFFVSDPAATGDYASQAGLTGLVEADFDVYAADAGSALPGTPVAATGYAITEYGFGLYQIAFSVATYTTTVGKGAVVITLGTDHNPSDPRVATIPYRVGTLDVNATQISGDATAADNLEAMMDGSGYVAATAPAQMQQVSNIAVTGAALNVVAASRTITTGTETGTLTNAQQDDGTTWDIADFAGTTDVYAEFDLTAASGAVAVGVQWKGYLAGIANVMKVYARNWGGASWDQIGSIQGIAGTVESTEEFELTSAHTQASLARVRFSNTGLTASSLKTDRLLLGYAAVPPTAAVIQAGLATAAALTAVAAQLPAALTAGGFMKSDVIAVSGDTTAADNLESQFDGTGYVHATAPARQDATESRRGTCQAGSTSTSIVLDAGASAVNSFYNEWVAVIIAGTGAGQARGITIYTGATKVGTIDINNPWGTTPDNTSQFVLISGGASITPYATYGFAQLTYGKVDTEIASIIATLATLATTANLTTAQADLTTLVGRLTALRAGYLDNLNVGGLVASSAEAVAIKAKTDNLPSDPADESLIIAATDAVMARLGAPAGASVSADIAGVSGRIPAALVSGRMDSSVGAMAANVITAAALAADAAVEIAVAVLAATIHTGWSVARALRVIAGGVAGKSSGNDIGAPVHRFVDDSGDAISGTTTSDGRTTASHGA